MILLLTIITMMIVQILDNDIHEVWGSKSLMRDNAYIAVLIIIYG